MTLHNMDETPLYGYQEEMKRRIGRAFGSFRSVMVQMPTGTGKTRLLASVVRDVVSQGPGSVVWIIAHRRELVAQIERAIESSGLPVDRNTPENCLVRVYSIQWLSRHLCCMDAEPSLIVIDEAHHALARSYSAVMSAYPSAMKLGMTATPCRLTGHGFTGLFDTLLDSRQISGFISDGYLSPFDYVSVPSDSDEIRSIDGLVKRAADGDYSISEMCGVLDTRPSIGRLYRTVADYAPGRKGITYAIDIEHAVHIAEYYRSHGLAAAAISSRTPAAERERLVSSFSEGRLQVLVNVDIFSEGFDCPDVGFIQMARPTLSLSKYLQQVGRGLRVHSGKLYCVLLDNVGLYRLFGLPSSDRDWQSMFMGRQRGTGSPSPVRSAYLQMAERESLHSCTDCTSMRMVVLARHDSLQEREGLLRLLGQSGSDPVRIEPLSCGWLSSSSYIRKGDPLQLFRRTGTRNFGRELLQDLHGGYHVLDRRDGSLVPVGRHEPWSVSVGNSIKKNPNAHENISLGLSQFHTEYIWPAEALGTGNVRHVNGWYLLAKGDTAFTKPVYSELSEARSGLRTFVDADGGHGIMNQDGTYYLLWGKSYINLSPTCMAYVKDLRTDCRGRWINLYTMQEFSLEPEHVRFGFVDLLKVGDLYFVQKIRILAGIALRRDDFTYNDDVFQLLESYVILRSSPHTVLRLDRCHGGSADRRFRLSAIPSRGSRTADGYISLAKLPMAVGRVVGSC